MSVLDADIAVKSAMSAGMASIGDSSKDSGDTDGVKRVNKGGVPGMEEDLEGFRYMPEEKWAPGKVLKLFPSQQLRQSSNKVPNFGFVDKQEIPTPEQIVKNIESKPRIRISKYKINTRTGEPIDDTEVEFDRTRFGKTFDMNPEVSDDIEENISDEMQEKSLGRTIGKLRRGGSLAGRAAARFGVIMDELGKMRCPPGTPAANQFTDATGSNCFGLSPSTITAQAIDLARRTIPDDDPRRTSNLTRKLVNAIFDLDNGIFGTSIWYDANGKRMRHGEWRKYRESGGVAKNERWMVNGAARVEAELDAQDARMNDLYTKLGVDTSDESRARNDDIYQAFEKLRESGAIDTVVYGRLTPENIEAIATARLKNMDSGWIARSDEEKRILMDIEVKRFRELERAHLEAFMDEVIKNPEHMNSIKSVRFLSTGRDRASYGIDGIDPDTLTPIGSIDIDIPAGLDFQDSLLPNIGPDERLRIWAEGGQSDAIKAMAVKDFLVNSNAHAAEMIAMVAGGKGIGRHDMKHEIGHSIQAAAIFEFMKKQLDERGVLTIDMGEKKKPVDIKSVNELTSGMLMQLMMRENFMGIDLESLNNLRSRGDTVAFLAGRYIWDTVEPKYGGNRRAAEIGAELWALRSSGLVYGDDVDAALEYMDNSASGKITADRDISDSVLTRRIYDSHVDGSRRIREAREERERLREYEELAVGESERLATEAAEFYDASERGRAERLAAARETYAKEIKKKIKQVKEDAQTMSEEDIVDYLVNAGEVSDLLSQTLDAAEAAGEELDWMTVMDRDSLDVHSKNLVDAWVKRFTVRRSPEAMEKLQNLIDDKREARGTLSDERIIERRHRDFLESATENARDMDLDELVQQNMDWNEMFSAEGVSADERARRKTVKDMYKNEYISRRTEGPDSVSKEEARKEFNSKLRELRKPKTTAQRDRENRKKPKQFKTHNGQDGARTFATSERARLLEGATEEEKEAFVQLGSGYEDVINMAWGDDSAIASAKAIQRRNTRLKKNGTVPNSRDKNEASAEEQFENLYIPLMELMDKSSVSQTVEMYIDTDDGAMDLVQALLSGVAPDFTGGISGGRLVTSRTDVSDGKKILVRIPEGSRAIFPDYSFYSESDDREQRVLIPPSKLHIAEVREDGTVVLEIGEQMGTEEAIRSIIEQFSPGDIGSGEKNWAYKNGLQKKLKKVVDKRIQERHRQGMFDPEKRSPIEEERFSSGALKSFELAGFSSSDDEDGMTWGRLASSDSQLSKYFASSNIDGFDEIYGPPQTREERLSQMVEMQNEVITSIREMIDNVPGAGNDLGFDKNSIDPYLLDFIKNSSDDEIYQAISEAAMSLHTSFDERPRVRMRQDELDDFIDTGRYGREKSFDTSERLSSGAKKPRTGIRARAKAKAVEMIMDRIGRDEDSREIAEIVTDTISSMKFGPKTAIQRLAIDLGKRGSREMAEKAVQELVDRGMISKEESKAIMKRVRKFAPDGLPEPLKRAAGSAGRAASRAIDTPENRERLSSGRDRVGRSAINATGVGRERLSRLRSRDEGEELEETSERFSSGEVPSTTADVPFGDFDPSGPNNRRLDRRVANSDAGRENIMSGANRTRVRLSSGETPVKEPREPFKPREPDNGPMTGKFIDIFRGAKSYQEMLDRYNEQEVVFFDYETTGLDHTVEKPVQIGAVRMKGGKVVERFNVFVNPEKPLSKWSLENLLDADGNPLTDEWLSGQASIREAHEQLLDFFGPDALLGGQYTPFDLNFLEQSLKDSGLEYTPAGVIDSKPLADELLPVWTPDGDGPSTINKNGKRVASNSLKPLAEYLGVELDAWHTADADSLASAEIVQKILERAAIDESVPKHLLDVDNIPGIVNQRRAKYKLEMEKYEEEMKRYKAEMARFKESQPAERLSSGESPKESKLLDRENSDLPEKAEIKLRAEMVSKQEEIEELEELNERLALARDELQETGNWEGQKYNIRIDMDGDYPPTTYTREELEASLEEGQTLEKLIQGILNQIGGARGARRWEIDKAKKEIEKIKADLDFISTREQNKQSFHIAELLADEDMAEDLRQRATLVTQMDRGQLRERFSDPNDPNVVYVLHWGASALTGGQLDPARSRGQVGDNVGIQGNTRRVNDETARYVVGLRNEARRDRNLLQQIKKQIDETGEVDLNEIARLNPTNPYAPGIAGRLMGIDRNDRSDVIKPNPDFVRNLDNKIQSEERTLRRLDKVADQLIADDYQYTSTYRATQLQDLFGSYGGRYAEDGSTEWGDNLQRSSTTGIHLFRVTLGEDAMEQNSVGETHLVGKHTPIASLIADNSPESKNPAASTWKGWVDMAIQEDLAKRGKSSGSSPSGERFSSGEAYKELVRTKGRPSEKQKQAISEVKEILKNDEFSIADGWDDDYGLTDSPERSEVKKKLTDTIKEAFSYDIEAREDVIVTGKNGEKINLGKDFEVVIKEIYAAVENYNEEALEQAKEEELYDSPAGSSGDFPSTGISLTLAIKPKNKEAAKRLEEAGIPEMYRPDYLDAERGFIGEPRAEDVHIATSVRSLLISGDEMQANHESLFIAEEAQGKGIGSFFNAKNEGVYEEMGVQRILTSAESSEIGETQGGTHWARNGFTWAGEKSKQDFIKVIDDALRKRKRKFSEEETERISSLYRRNPSTGNFETDATAEELVDFEYADQLFQEEDVAFMFKRDIELASAGGSRFSSGESKNPRDSKPKRVKKYKGYDLSEPDNPTPKDGEFPDDVVEAAKKHRAEIEKVEAEITKLLIDLAEKNNARMEGLDFRLKSLKSLMRKIAAEKDSEHDGDAEAAAKSMSDVVRYTMSYSPEDYVEGIKGVIDAMKESGYEMRIKNYWKGGDPYQGINVAVTHPDGTQFELQFHTPQSVVEKEKIHLLYEEYRTSQDPRQRFTLYNRMVRIAEKIDVPYPPDELLNIGIVKEQPFTPR